MSSDTETRPSATLSPSDTESPSEMPEREHKKRTRRPSNQKHTGRGDVNSAPLRSSTTSDCVTSSPEHRQRTSPTADGYKMSEMDWRLLHKTVQELILLLTVERDTRSGKYLRLVHVLCARLRSVSDYLHGQKVVDLEQLVRLALDGPPPTEMARKSLKVPVPEHPNYNYIGRILGPRGISVRQLEAATGCGILIRGKGSIKDKEREAALLAKGSGGFEHLSEPLHVLLTAEGVDEADCDRKLEACRERIEALLKPEFDDLKRHQLAHLAMINGTYEARDFPTVPPNAL